jgi:hypothetical protein
MKMFKTAVLLLTLSLSGAAYGATELGEFCFSGSFFKEGNCNISLELTGHTKYYSMNGIVDCDVKTNDDGISGVATGSGYIDGNTFIGSLIIPHQWGQVGVSLSQVSTNSMTIEVNLSNLNAVFRKTTSSNEVCGPGFLATCIEEAVFTPTACP